MNFDIRGKGLWWIDRDVPESLQQQKKERKIFIRRTLDLFHDTESAKGEMLEANLYLERDVTVCQTIG